MSFIVNILGYGDITVKTMAERNKYLDLANAFIPDAVNSGNTNMNSQVRLTDDNPLLTAVYNSVGLPQVPINPITIVDWNTTYTEPAQKVSNIKNKTVDKYSPIYNPALASSTSPCDAGNCNIFYILGAQVYVWNFTSALPHHTGSVPLMSTAIATYGNRWYVGDIDEFNQWDLNTTTCDSTWIRQIPYGPSTHLLGMPSGSCMRDGFDDIVIGGGENCEDWILEFDISGATTVNTDLFQIGTVINAINPPTASGIIYRSASVQAMIHLGPQDELVTIEKWKEASPPIEHIMAVVRTRITGVIICSVELILSGGETHGLFCFGGQIYGMHYDMLGVTQGVYNITYDPTIPVITYDPTMLASHFGIGAASESSCCGTGVVNPVQMVGHCCVDCNGDLPSVTWPGWPWTCTNATANCGGNNCDGVIVTSIQCIDPNTGSCGPCQGLTIFDADLIDFNGNVIQTIVGQTMTTTIGWLNWENLCTGNYTVHYYNVVQNGIAQNDMNVNCIVLGDTPWTCQTNPSCCPPAISFDCVNGQCIDPGTGLGQYPTIADCNTDCGPGCPEIFSEHHDDCSDFDVCIGCDNTIIY